VPQPNYIQNTFSGDSTVEPFTVVAGLPLFLTTSQCFFCSGRQHDRSVYTEPAVVTDSLLSFVSFRTCCRYEQSPYFRCCFAAFCCSAELRDTGCLRRNGRVSSRLLNLQLPATCCSLVVVAYHAIHLFCFSVLMKDGSVQETSPCRSVSAVPLLCF
jgi:hypothetical protein